MSTKRTAVVSLVASQAVAGPELLYGGEHLVLQALAPLEVGFLFVEGNEELANQATHGRVPLGSCDPSPAIHFIGQ